MSKIKFKGIEYHFQLNAIASLKMQRIASEFGMSASQLGDMTPIVMIAAASSDPYLVLSSSPQEIEELMEFLKDRPEFTNYLKQAENFAKKKPKKKVKKKPHSKY